MGLLDIFNDPYQPSASIGTAGLLSPEDKLMALFQGLSGAGMAMAQPGLSKGQALAMGLGGLGQGMARGRQTALQERLFLEKLMDQQRQKAARDQYLKDNPQYAGIAGAAPGEFFSQAAKNAIPQAPTPPKMGELRKYSVGDKEVTQEWTGQGWQNLGEGGRFHEPWRDPNYVQTQKDIRAAGAPNMSVRLDQGPQFGTIPPGHTLERTPTGYQMTPIPGSPAALALQKEKDAKTEATAQRAQATDVVTQDIRRALDLMDQAILPTTGALGPMVAQIGGTNAGDIKALVDTVKANTAFDKLAEMRKASPTGAALGSVTERELALLAAVRGNLEQSQSAEQFRRNLTRLNNTMLDIVHGPGAGPDRIADKTEARPPEPKPAGRKVVIQNGMRFDATTGEYLGQAKP